MRMLMSETLAESGYNIETTDNGTDALRIINEKTPDLVLLDVRMPGKSGFEVCAEVRATSDESNIAIVMVTGLEDGESIERAYNLGATAFISKPINWMSFPYRIQYILKAREAFNEIQQREVQLQHLVRISKIVTSSSDIETKLDDIQSSLLNICGADRVIMLKDTHTNSGLEVHCETHHDGLAFDSEHFNRYLIDLDSDIFARAISTDQPILSSHIPNDQTDDQTIQQQIVQSVVLENKHIWYIIVQQCRHYRPWNTTDIETLNRIASRVRNMLNSHLMMEKLHTNEKLLKQAQQIGHLGDWHWHADSGELNWSDEVFRIFGYEPGSFTPEYEKFYRVRREDDCTRLMQIKQTAFNTTDTYDITYNIHLENGQARWIHEHGIGKFDNRGNLTEINGIVQDITDRHKQQVQEVHDHKMEAIGQLTSGVAHDFGNLMTVAKGNLDMLDDMLGHQGILTKEGEEILADARSAVVDGVQLTKQLLAFSRKKSIAPEYINIKKTITRFKKLLKNTAGDSIQLSISVQPDLPDILVDMAQFESSLLNLVLNARNAMENGGKIEIIAETLPNTSEEIIRNPDNDIADTCISLSVVDNGVGMEKEVLSHAIEPFFTTNKNDGTGLGLSMVYGFIRQSHGELQIDSVPEQGTCIQMQFPIYGGSSETNCRKPVDEPPPSTEATILVVEDRKAVRQFAVRCLSVASFTILEADDATSAKRMLKKNHVDLLFSDIIMPGEMNGRELAAWAQDAQPNLKILLTTASERQASIVSADSTHNIPLLQKPYSRQELMESIQDTLA